MSGSEVRAVIVDDSATARALLAAVLEAGGIEVVGQAINGAEAVRLVDELRPSVVVMDIDMPVLDGFEATRRIMASTPTPIVIVTASRRADDVAVSHRAIELGALTVQPKPLGPFVAGHVASSRRLVGLVRAMADVKVVGRRGTRAEVTEGAVAARVCRTSGSAPIELVGVGASTGGPVALYSFLKALSADLSVPVLVVQHLPDGFVDGFVRWLATATALPVKVAKQMAPLTRGVHVAPHGCHLEVTSTRRVRLVTSEPVQGFRPSVSTLFSSLAVTAGPAAAAVVLTGMGNDGLAGARAIRAHGGRVLVQDEESSVVFGMPRVVAQAGLADVVGTVEELAKEITAAAAARQAGRTR